MKLKFLIFFVLLFLFNPLFCQEIDTTKTFGRKQLNSVLIFKNINDSLLNENTLLKNKNELLETSLKSNNYVFSGISTYLTALSIILLIIGIAIPFLNYYIVIKPNKKVKKKIKNLEENLVSDIENRFEHIYQNFEKKKIKKLFEKLDKSMDYSTLISFIHQTNYSDFDDDDQRIVVNFLKKNLEMEFGGSSSLNSILISMPSDVATLFYKETFESKNNNNHKYAIEYLVKNNFFPFLKKEIINSNNGSKYMIHIFEYISDSCLSSYNTSKQKEIGQYLIEKYLNDKDICKSLKIEKPLIKTDNIFNILLNSVYETPFYKQNPFIKNTCYYKLFLKDKISEPKSFLTM